jgi:hypothetical protein
MKEAGSITALLPSFSQDDCDADILPFEFSVFFGIDKGGMNPISRQWL